MQQHIRNAGPAVRPQKGNIAAGILAHGQHQVCDLGSNTAEHRPGDVRPSCAPGDAQDRAPGVHIPVRRTQAREGRYHHHAAAVRHCGGQHVDLRCRGNDTQLIPQPLDGAAGVEHAALQGIGGLSVHLPGHGGQQSGAGAHRLFAHVHQGEAAGAVGVLGFAGSEAGLAEQGGLLIARRAADRDARQGLQPRDTGLHRAVDGAVGHGLRQHGRRAPQNAAQLLIPGQAVDIKKHGAAGIGVVGDMPAGELPDQPALHGTEQHLAPFGPAADAGHIVQYPADLAAGEVGVDQQPRGRADALLQPPALQLLAQLRRPAALPDDGVVHRFTGGLIPEDRRLPLVGDADPRHAALRQPGDDLRRGAALGVPYLQGVVLHPPRLGIVLGQGLLA